MNPRFLNSAFTRISKVAYSSMLIVLALLALSAQKVQAEEWKKLFQQDLATFYINMQAIEAVGEQKAFWLQVMVENPYEVSIKPIEEVRMKQLMDCQKRAISEPIAWENRDGDGKVSETGQRPTDAIEWVPLDELDGANELESILCKQS
jgi:hypothetical protein